MCNVAEKKPRGPSAVNSCFCLNNDPLTSRILLCHLFLLPLGPFLFFGSSSFVLPFLLLLDPPLIHVLFRIVVSVLVALPTAPVVILCCHWSPAAKKLQKNECCHQLVGHSCDKWHDVLHKNRVQRMSMALLGWASGAGSCSSFLLKWKTMCMQSFAMSLPS